MQISFDISDEELPIFVAETGEHMQVLDEGLVRLEREAPTPDLIQVLFRAAHTLKGTAGMIGHKRMVDLTHALENTLDALRKDQIEITTEMIDTCLEAVDTLRFLCDEVLTGEVSAVETGPLTARFAALAHSAGVTLAAAPAAAANQSSHNPAHLYVNAEIAPDSIATAARAFQLMMALQDFGEIVVMQPDQAQIETAAPVTSFFAEVKPTAPKTPELVAQVKKALGLVSEIKLLQVEGEEIFGGAAPKTAAAPPAEVGRLGEVLLQHNVISSEQLQTALAHQAENPGPGSMLGRTLIQMGFTTQDVIDQVMADKSQPKAAPRPPEASDEKGRVRAAEKTIRTSVERLDTLMNLVGELITDRNRLYQIRSEFEARFRGDTQIDTLSETITHVGRITDQLQAEVMGIRMLPISNVFNKFPRLVRDLAHKAGKQVELVIRGEDTELDRSVIEEISDPLIHLLRNSLDHGLETPEERRAAGKPERGTVLLTARHEQGRIIITVEDDGRGINLDRVRAKAIEKGIISEKDAAALTQEETVDLIFAAGLSTAQKVSDVSGRGVGMDIVRNNVEHLNGNILVETWPGRGSQFQIVMPLTLAIVPTLLVRVGRGVYAIPLVTVTETLRVAEEDIKTINARPVILLRDHVLPVTQLASVFDIHQNGSKHKYKYVVVVRSGKSQMGLIVDTLVGEQEVVVKSLSSAVGDVTGISSAAILGDGQVALILDVQGLFKLASQRQAVSNRKAD
jgi:two-component system chemotaxis sensor kinase CheA